MTRGSNRSCALRGQHAHLPPDGEAIADTRQVVEDIAQVPARFALHEHRGDKEPRVDDGRSRREVFQRVSMGWP